MASACGGAGGLVPAATRTPTPSPAATAALTAPPPEQTAELSAEQRTQILVKHVARLIDRIDPDALDRHMRTLAGFGSRDPRHPGHAKAVAYIKEELARFPGIQVATHRAAHQGIALENILATIDPVAGPPADGWIVIAAHYDSIAVRTPGWRPAVDPAPGADDNATGTAALLEYARVLADGTQTESTPALPFLRTRVILAFFDGEELFYKGSAAYLQSLPEPYPISHVVNIDMVGFNPIADRLDLIWYGAQSDDLRDLTKAMNERHRIGLQLVEVHANAQNRLIVDSAPFGLAGIPAVSLVERYGPPDATYPGNDFFHTVNDTPDKVTNPSLWSKAAKLTLATALELARAE